MAPEELLAVYDAEVRGSFADRLPAGWVGERDGPLTRCTTPRNGFAMLTEDASGLDLDELASLVDRTFAYFGERTIVQVDATDDSRPILERLGLHVVGGTTPYLCGPARA